MIRRPMSEVLRAIHQGVIEGDAPGVQTRVKDAMDGRVPVQDIIDAMSGAMTEVGDLFEAGEYFVPEMLVSARAMQAGMKELKPVLMGVDVRSAGLVVAGTVKGDLHEIGKNLVCMMLECAGFQVIDLGMDVSPERFVAAVKEYHPQLLAMSALLTTTMPNMKATVDALRAAGVREQVKVMVGGAPVTEAYARQAGADAYAKDASQAVKTAHQFVGVT